MVDKQHSSAPHVYSASDSANCLLFEAETGLPQAGIRVLEPGDTALSFADDELCHIVKGRAMYKADNGEIISVKPGTVIHFKQGWSGAVEISQSLRCIYMTTQGGEAVATPVLRDVEKISELTDWGSVEEPIEGVSKVCGVLLSREADGRAESGIWVCTPGSWRCVLTSDELCHFLYGRCTYTHDNGEVIEIEADTAAFFPQGWSGQCQVHETVRKVYMIR